MGETAKLPYLNQGEFSPFYLLHFLLPIYNLFLTDGHL